MRSARRGPGARPWLLVPVGLGLVLSGCSSSSEPELPDGDAGPVDAIVADQVFRCAKDADCGPGRSCQVATGECHDLPGKKLGEACTKNEECATKYCLPARHLCSAICNSSASCGAGAVCGLETYDKDQNGSIDSAQAVCLLPRGSGKAGSACTKDDDCASSHCYDGFCFEGCAASADCGGLDCAEVQLLLDGATPKYKGCLPKQGVGGIVSVGTYTNDSKYRGFSIPPGATSFLLYAQGTSASVLPSIWLLKDPDGKSLLYGEEDECKRASQPLRYSVTYEVSTLMVPNAPASVLSIKPGLYTYLVGSSPSNVPVTIKLQLKMGQAKKGTLNINWFFLNLDGTCVPAPRLQASSAPTHAWFQAVRKQLATLLQQASLTIGRETYHDIDDPTLDSISVTEQPGSNLYKLWASSKGMQGDAINIFLVREVRYGIYGGTAVTSLAPSTPGPAGIHGTAASGVVIGASPACKSGSEAKMALAMVHETFHFLGLNHPQEPYLPGYDVATSKVVCPCPCGTQMTCLKEGSSSYCAQQDTLTDTDGADSGNIMYWNAVTATKLSAQQIRVLLDNPLVGF